MTTRYYYDWVVVDLYFVVNYVSRYGVSSKVTNVDYLRLPGTTRLFTFLSPCRGRGMLCCLVSEGK